MSFVTTANAESVGETPKSLRADLATPASDQACSPDLLIRSEAERPGPGLARYVPLLVWTFVLATLLFIPLKIISYGILAPGDARRHVAKAFTDKPYTDIIVMRPEYKMDHSPGWEWLLREIHQKTGWGSDQLMSFSVVSMMLCIFLAPLAWLRRPEAWLGALLAEMIAIPELMTRFVQARPYLLTEAILMAVLFTWSREEEEKKPSYLKLGLTAVGIALSVWVHGAWYLWALPLAAFFLAGRWRTGLWLAGCLAVGTVMGATLTGRPVEFLQQALLIVGAVSKEHVPQWILVGELRPSYGEFTTAALIAVVMLWRRQELMRGEESQKIENRNGVKAEDPNEIHDGRSRFVQTVAGGPVFWLIVICWILGFKADRFWADWGMPAVLVWLTFQFEGPLIEALRTESPKRLLACGVLAVPLFLHATNDLDRRYTGSLDELFLDGSKPALQAWVPESNGIFYTARMDFFYNTFYKNPQANWRYILGMEPALMPAPDLTVLRQIQTQPSFRAYEPWAEKMHPEDRLAIFASGQPNLSRLEWTNAVADLWIGRLPRENRP